MDSSFSLLEVRNSRDSEEAPAVMEQVFAALGTTGGHGGLLRKLFGKQHAGAQFFSFELVSVNAGIHFFVGVPPGGQTYLESQLTAQYPKVLFSPASDYVPHFLALPHAVGQLALGSAYYYPLKT